MESVFIKINHKSVAAATTAASPQSLSLTERIKLELKTIDLAEMDPPWSLPERIKKWNLTVHANCKMVRSCNIEKKFFCHSFQNRIGQISQFQNLYSVIAISSLMLPKANSTCFSWFQFVPFYKLLGLEVPVIDTI